MTSGGLDQYKDFVISEINAVNDTVEFTNGHSLQAGEATGDVNEAALRRIQIREAIRAHFDKEKVLFGQNIKTLSLFFIDKVSKYRVYSDAGEDEGGEYAKVFEEEYQNCLNELHQDLFLPEAYKKYLSGISTPETHNGYFSIDKKSKQMVDPSTGKRSTETDDVDAYDLILKDKERLLSFEEPTRFIFSHSALREGWDNPNVFTICTLKHSDNTVSRRQEVGRGLRIAVNQQGERQDDPATVHETNVLTVVASESYKDFVTALQKDISEALSERPREANVNYFTGKVLLTETGQVEVTQQMAKQICRYLVKNDYTDLDDHITNQYIDAEKNGALAELPEELKPYKEQVVQLINSVYSDAKMPQIGNGRGKVNPLNKNFEKKEFKELWNRINHKAVYSVDFDSSELVKKCINELNHKLEVAPLQYIIERGEQLKDISYEQIKSGEGFTVNESETGYSTSSIHSAVKYDLIGKIAESVQLTRRTVTKILSQIEKAVFAQFKTNPEGFISKAVQLITEQKATCIIEHLSYDTLSETFGSNIFTDGQVKQDFTKAGDPLKRHIYDYVITDSGIERSFVKELDVSSEVVVYAKLPKGFSIPTPVGNYNPDWAISFKEGTVKHVYFVAETKGTMSTMELRKTEEIKIE